MNFKKWAYDNLIFKTLTGSRLYGTSNARSDFDYRGVCLDPPETLLGIHRFGQYERIDNKHDEIIYSVSKFINLCAAANPSILDVLFAPREFWEFSDRGWIKLYEARHAFLSDKVRHTFSGYAHSQLERIKRHKRWIDNPLTRPIPEEYGLYLFTAKKGAQKLEPVPELHTINISGMRAAIRNRSPYIRKDKTALLSRYESACKEYKRYAEWVKNRNPERARLEFSYGYDVKHAGHLVRLLLQGRNILAYQDYNPVLTGKDLRLVRSVLAGNIAYDDLILWANANDEAIKTMPSGVQKKPNAKIAHSLLRVFAAESLRKDPGFMHAMWEADNDRTTGYK